MKKSDKQVYLLGASSFANDIGSEMITPLLPFLITSMGGGGIAVGLVSGIREGLSSIVKLIGGWLSDVTGKRKKYIVFGYLLSIIFRVFIAFATTWQAIISFVSLERFGKVRDAPRDAIISDTTKRRGRAFGIHQMMDASGSIVGLLLILLLLFKFEFSFKAIILVAAAISAFSLIPLAFLRKEHLKPTEISLFKGYTQLSPRLKYLILVLGIFTLGNFGLYLFIILMINSITGTIFLPLLFYLFFNIVAASFMVPFGKMSDKYGKKNMLLAGFALFVIVSVCFAFVGDNLFMIFFLFGFYGLVNSMTLPSQRAFVGDLAGNNKGTAIGFYYFIIGLINVLAGILAGVLWEVSPRTMFIFVAGTVSVALILLSFVKYEEN